MSLWLAITKKLPVLPRLSPFKTSLSKRRAMHCRLQKRMASETHLTMCPFLIIFFLFSSSYQLFSYCYGFSTDLRKDSVAIMRRDGPSFAHVYLPFPEAYASL